MQKHILIFILAALIILPPVVSVNADAAGNDEFIAEDTDPVYIYVEGSELEVGDGEYRGYDLYYEHLNPKGILVHNPRSWLRKGGSKKNGYIIEWVSNGLDYSNANIKVPDKINRTDIISISGSCGFKKFDLNPENKYMECVDNVIFSKDGKTLMSYAQYDERTEYVIPDGTEIIAASALSCCGNLTSVIIPNTVKKIESGALSINNLTSIKMPCELEIIPHSCFWADKKLTSVSIPQDSKLKSIESDAFRDCRGLSELYIPSFEIKIDRGAFGENGEKSFAFKTEIKLKSYVSTVMRSEGNSVAWDKVSNAAYYEVYQKLSSGEYKLLKTTKATSCKFSTLKKGKKYTFAVKPVAVIPAANYNREEDEGYYPESFTIEGTMSEDVVVIGE